MNDILFPVLIVTGIGLLAGLLLVIASKLMAVPRDEKAEAVQECLPGANCGACGYSGCAGYAEALAKGEAENGLCTPGGQETAKKIAAIIGGGEVSVEAKVAVIQCMGSEDFALDKMEYEGIPSCAAAVLVAGGKKSCRFACLGYGDCAAVCPSHAIEVCNGVAHVKKELCTGCGICAKACPKKVIELLPRRRIAVVACSNCDKGAQVTKACKVGCIGCGKCIKACPNGAVKVENFLAKIDPSLCTGCGLCAESCPRKCIQLLEEE